MTIHISKTEIYNIVRNIKAIQLASINQMVLFIGHAHSGHSIVGSILDAHGHISFANEVNIVKLVKDYKLTKSEIESILIHYSLLNERTNAWHNSEYVYRLENSMQGKTKCPFVIGDKKAGGTTRLIYNNPWLLDYLLELFDSTLKFVFVKRNPVDIVAAYSYYMKQPPSQFHIDRYQENLDTVNFIKKEVSKNQFIEIQQEAFVNEPSKIIRDLLVFLKANYNKNEVDKWVKNVKSNIPGKSNQIKIPKILLDQL